MQTITWSIDSYAQVRLWFLRHNCKWSAPQVSGCRDGDIGSGTMESLITFVLFFATVTFVEILFVNVQYVWVLNGI